MGFSRIHCKGEITFPLSKKEESAILIERVKMNKARLVRKELTMPSAEDDRRILELMSLLTQEDLIKAIDYATALLAAQSASSSNLAITGEPSP